jgi:hypothetical protein
VKMFIDPTKDIYMVGVSGGRSPQALSTKSHFRVSSSSCDLEVSC